MVGELQSGSAEAASWEEQDKGESEGIKIRGTGEAASVICELMKIRALEIEEDGRIYRYTGEMRLESQWELPGEKSNVKEIESTTNVGVDTKDVAGSELCECGHADWDHIPACLYIPQGCECGGYREKKSDGSGVSATV